MFHFEVSNLSPSDIKEELTKLPERLDNLKLAVGNSIAEAVRKDVVKRIPTAPGWYSIYKKAIDVSFDGDKEWVVAGEKDLSITAVDAEKTLIFFSGNDKASAVLTAYNPWPVDMVPAINAIYTSKITIRPASESEVKNQRKKIAAIFDKIKSKLSTAGYTYRPGELPKFGNNTVADLAFLAQRLENGLGDFPRVPHWGPAADNISATIATTLKSVNSRYESILRGNTGARPHTLTAKLKSMLSSAVRKSPAE